MNRAHMFNIPLPDPNKGSFQVMDMDIDESYDTSQRLFWMAKELVISNKDTSDFNALSEDFKKTIRLIVSFFSSADGYIIDANNSGNTGKVGQVDIDRFIGFKTEMEQVHARTYKRIFDATPGATDLLSEIALIPGLKGMKGFLDNVGGYVDAELAQRGLEVLDPLRGDLTYSAGLIAEACFEGIFFISSFVFIYWFAEKGKMPGLVAANELIGRDEGMHTKVGCLIYSKLLPAYKLSGEVLKMMVRDAVELVDEFNTYLIGGGYPGLNITMMRDYIKICANIITKLTGHGLMYDVQQPFPFMEKQNVENRTDFFVRKPTEYARTSSTAQKEHVDPSMIFKLDEDF